MRRIKIGGRSLAVVKLKEILSERCPMGRSLEMNALERIFGTKLRLYCNDCRLYLGWANLSLEYFKSTPDCVDSKLKVPSGMAAVPAEAGKAKSFSTM